LNGCCSGKFTNSIFGVVYPKFADAGGLASYPVLPTQLFEMAFAIIILIPALIVQKKSDKFPEGSAFLVYANLFCIMRLFILPFRRLPYKSWVKHYFYPALYLILIFISLVIFLYRYIKNRKVNEKGY
jgi:prolipoprotein diacylglyceryltransferase